MGGFMPDQALLVKLPFIHNFIKCRYYVFYFELEYFAKVFKSKIISLFYLTNNFNIFKKKLEDLMRRINSMKLNQLPRGQIECGTPCLARYSMDNSIYRAVILSRGDLVEVI